MVVRWFQPTSIYGSFSLLLENKKDGPRLKRPTGVRGLQKRRVGVPTPGRRVHPGIHEGLVAERIPLLDLMENGGPVLRRSDCRSDRRQVRSRGERNPFLRQQRTMPPDVVEEP